MGAHVHAADPGDEAAAASADHSGLNRLAEAEDDRPGRTPAHDPHTCAVCNSLRSTCAVAHPSALPQTWLVADSQQGETGAALTPHPGLPDRARAPPPLL